MEKRIFTDPTGQQLKAARTWLGWSLDDAAEASGINRQTIYRVESGQSEGSRSTIRAIVQAYANAGVWLDRGLIMAEDEYEARP
jgi:transcriptional regulator with XRE-family HTH domain